MGELPFQIQASENLHEGLAQSIAYPVDGKAVFIGCCPPRPRRRRTTWPVYSSLGQREGHPRVPGGSPQLAAARCRNHNVLTPLHRVGAGRRGPVQG